MHTSVLVLTLCLELHAKSFKDLADTLHDLRQRGRSDDGCSGERGLGGCLPHRCLPLSFLDCVTERPDHDGEHVPPMSILLGDITGHWAEQL